MGHYLGQLARVVLWPVAIGLLANRAQAQTESSKLCAGCHKSIWESYRKTGMGRSFFRPSPATMIEDFSHSKTYYHQPSESYFTMLQRDGRYWQKRYQIDNEGKPVNAMEKQIDYILGSGNHARTYLHRTSTNTLIELPLGWYAERGGSWAMNPGYDRPNHDGFRRPITYDCMFCHNAYPAIPAGSEKPFAPAVYAGVLPEGIDCQRCHGSGARHAKLAGTPGTRPDEIRKAIVNPSRLSAERQLEVCMVCHLETTSFPLPNAIERYDRGPFSFRPGEPMGDFILNFDHAPGKGRDDKFEIVSSAYRLRKSACFLKSNGKMLCTTCHNPHDVPRGEAASVHYNGVCRQCHAAAFEQQVAGGKHTRASNCVDCHMPKRRTEDVVHAVATDHFIQRLRPAGNLIAERAERQETGDKAYRGPVVLYYPPTLPLSPENELYLAVAQVKQGSNVEQGIAQMTRLIDQYKPARAEWRLELAEALESSGQRAKAIAVYRDALLQDPRSALLHQKLGSALRLSGQMKAALESLNRAVSLAPPGSALTWHEIGLAYRGSGKTTEAIAALSKALERDPDMPEAHNNLGGIRLAAGDMARAEQSFREAIRIRPDFADAHANLAGMLAATDRPAEARAEFAAALRLRPADAATRFNYGMLLGRGGQYNEARRELEAAVLADPNFADAREVLGDMLMSQNQAAPAAVQYREALRIRPESDRAHLGLGAALLATGDRQGAQVHLNKATASPDAAIRQKAAEVLRQIK